VTRTCDVLVIGGGPAGSVAAALLARTGWSVIVVERKRFPRRKVCGEYLSATNWPLFTDLGLADEIDRRAGPEIQHVGLFVGDQQITAELPIPSECGGRWGRALSREHLDTLLLERAAALGAEVLQPWDAEALSGDGPFVCRAASAENGEVAEISAGTVIAAHGSWEMGPLPTQTVRRRPSGGDLLGFKAHFHNASLPEGLMPLVCFPGGYGGMVRMEDGRMSLSCCLRRDQLERLQRDHKHGAGEAVRAHIEMTTPVVRDVLASATSEGHWLSAGPIQPGVRSGYDRGIFRIGNAAGEAHPAVAEGITMAVQSAQMLVDLLAARRDAIHDPQARNVVGRAYAAAWRAGFARRVRVSNLIAQWAMRPRLVRACLPLVRRFPKLLTWGARQSGKIDVPTLRTASALRSFTHSLTNE
jgi:menaquinone-9 beta-reductase